MVILCKNILLWGINGQGVLDLVHWKAQLIYFGKPFLLRLRLDFDFETPIERVFVAVWSDRVEVILCGRNSSNRRNKIDRLKQKQIN
jgi:hypothetical protein